MDSWSEMEIQLRQCSLVELERLATGLELDDSAWKEEAHEGRKKKKVLRTIEDAVDEVDSGDQHEHMKTLFMPHLPERVARNLLAGLFKEEPTRGVPPAVKTDDRSFISTLTTDADRLTQLADTVTLLKSLGLDASASTSSFRREFKISGTIGSAQKDHLTYISLCGQVSEGKKRGYPDTEIATAIRKAVLPGTNLRTYLDSKIDIPLDQVISFIRSYLKEKSSTELFQDLNNMVQLENEDAQTFVLRAMETREKVLMASGAEGSIRYDADLVQSLFQHTIRTGLTDDAIKSGIEPLIRKGAVTPDDILIQEVNVIASEEAERKKKIGNGATSCRKRVGFSEVNTRPQEPDNPIACSIQAAMAPLLAEFKSMTNEIKTLKEEVNQLKSSSRKKYSRGCNHCKQNGKADTCRHCWFCGAGDHVSSSCPKKSSPGTPPSSN